MTTKSRFGALDLNDGATPTLAAAPTLSALPEALRGQETDTSASHGDIDAEGRKRAIASAEIATRHGLVPTEATFYSFGTRGQWGTAAAKKRAEFNARPLISKVAADVEQLIQSERRRADIVTLSDLRYGSDDKIRRAKATGNPGIAMTRHALGQLLQRSGAAPFATNYLTHPTVPAEMRVPHVQHWLNNAPSIKIEDKQVPITGSILSKNNAAGERYAYGVVSDKYARYDIDAVMRDVAKAVPGTSRATMVYNAESTRWRLDVSIGAQFEPVVGDVHTVILRFRGSDAGAGSIIGGMMAERARCLNFSTIRLNGKNTRVRHVGTTVGERVRALLEVQGAALQEFAAAWKDANEEAIIGRALQGDGEARKVFGALVDAGHVDAPEGKEMAVERFFNAWLEEPGYMRSDFVNAITRSAHEAQWSSPWVSEALEDQASELLYNRLVLNPDKFA